MPGETANETKDSKINVADSNTLRIGDFVTLKYLKRQSYLSSEGVINEDVQVSPTFKFFEEHLFQICVQRQYSATNELEEFTEKYHDKIISNDLDNSLKNHWEALLKGKANEIILNKNVMKSKIGNLVCLGDTIQLLHVKSKKFLIVRPKDLSRDEKENMKVGLSTDGSVLSWIKIVPRYKINRDGEPLVNNLEIMLKVVEKNNEFIHCADRPPPKGKFREVNSSMEMPTPWRIALYQRAEDMTNSSLLLAGELVSIRDPESFSLLTPVGLPLNLNHYGHQNRSSHGDDDGSESEDTPVREFINENGEVALQPMDEDNIETNAIWMMESKQITKGGIVHFKNDKIRLRHFNTGKYLALRSMNDSDDTFVYSLVTDPDESSTLFQINQLHSAEDYLKNSRPMQLKQAHYSEFLERGVFNDELKIYQCKSARNKNKALSMILNRYNQKKAQTNEKKANEIEQMLDVYFGNAVIQQISMFVTNTVVPPSLDTEALSIWPKLEMTEIEIFANVVSRASLFLKGYPILMDESITDLSKFKLDKNLSLTRQNMMRDQGLVQDILIMLDLLQPVSSWQLSDLKKGATPALLNFVSSTKEILTQCLSLLYEVIRQNLNNQIYISDNLLVILSHVSTDQTAAKVAKELLSSNRELQEKKIGPREITIFAEKMIEIPMNAMYLQLLETCCSCLGEGVAKNQDIVKRVLFEKYKQLLIYPSLTDELKIPTPLIDRRSSSIIFSSTHQLSNDPTSFKSNVSEGGGSSAHSLFIEPYANGNKIRGLSLMSSSLPTPVITWTSDSSNYSPLRIFGKDIVPLEECFMTINSTLGSPSNQSTNDLKYAIGEFIISQLQLSAEMCLDRNYPVMKTMENLYSFEMLVIILKSFKSEKLKSAAAYLILTLYIDRDPQSHTNLPKLTRVFSEITKNTITELVSVDEERVPEFALLQFIISQHLDDVKGKPFPLYTYNLMQILQKLISFHYYGNGDKLMAIIHLLVHSLKRDESDIESGPRAMSPNSPSRNRNSLSPVRSVSYEKLSTSEDEGEDVVIMQPLMSRSEKNNKEEENALAIILLDAIESLSANVITLAVALASSAVTIYQFVEKKDNMEYFIFNVVIFAFFAAEVVTHFILHMIVRKSFKSFILDVYNLLDVFVVLLLAIQFFNIGASNFVKLARILRLVVLFKLLESRRVEQKIENLLNDEGITWEEPDRYIKTPEYTLKTLVKIVDILCSIQDNIQDRVLIFLLKAFDDWSKQETPQTEEICEILGKVFENTESIHVSDDSYDDIYIDLLMYSNPALVQSSLQLLMTHHSSRRILVDNLTKLQLITTPEGEEQFSSLEQIVTKLKRNADKHDIWGKLSTPEHKAINDEMLKYIPQITKDCKKMREVLKFDESYEPVKATQNILRNLGCFDLCMKIVKLIIPINPNDIYSEGNVNTRNLALITNELIYWFILDNPANQSLVFTELRFFIKTIDEKINSNKVIKAIFSNNITLMEAVSKKHISEFAEMIVANGKFPQYLAMMSSILAIGDKNVIDNQYEVIKYMSSPDNQKKVIQYFVPASHSEYQKKIRLMNPFLDVKDVSIDELPNDLAYHLELITLLSSCTLGKSGMTSIEAKVQSMFFFVDIIEAMLDPNCLLLGKIKLGLYFYNSVIDVETLLPVLKDADCIWKFITSAVDVFSFAKDELRQIEKNGWAAPSSSRQKVEYIVVCAMMINGYFSMYYDSSIFRPEVGQSVGVERVQLKEHQGNDLIQALYIRISLLYEMVSPLLPLETHELFYQTLVTLNNCAKTRFVAEVENKHVAFYQSAAEYSVGNSNDIDSKFETFTSALSSDSKIKEFVNDEVANFINKLESIPWKDAGIKSDVCFEPLLEKIIAHIRGSVQVIIHGDDTIKFIEPAASKTAIWILKVLRNIIEKRWGMTIYERDDDGGEEQDDAVADLMVVYNNCGVTVMCLDLISKGIEVELKSEASKLLVAMLFKEGGALEIQKTINHHLTSTASDMFFRTVRATLQNLISWHKWNGVITLEEDAEPDLLEEIILVRTLQLFSEGHYCPNQDLMREQPNNMVSINILDDLVQYLQALDPLKCRTSSAAEGSVAALVLEVLQGPCVQNQEYLALSTELLENINKKLRQRTVGDCIEEEEMDLKKGYIEILQALLEGQGKKTAVYERMLSVIHIDVLIVLCRGKIDMTDSEEEESEESVALRVESSVLFQMLVDYRPSLLQELAIEDSFIDNVGDLVACIEIVWRGELQRRFFNVPEICLLLAKSTKDNFISSVKRTSPEDKLYGLLESAKDIYNEIKHQQILKEYRVDSIFSRTNEDRSTWLSFIVVMIINGLFLIYYTTVAIPCNNKTDDAFIEYIPYYSLQPNTTFNVTCNQIYLNPTITLTTFILTLLVIATALFTLTLIFVVRVPLNYKTYIEAELGVLQSILYTAMDFSTMYYFIYICIAIVGLKFHFAMTFLLLDFVKKNSTAQAVLQAVYIPRKQLFMTILLTFILIYIFAMFDFFFLNSSDHYTSLQNVISLKNTFKFFLRWGFPYYSSQNYMELNITARRVVNDVCFFIVTALMANILKGITIDTFVEIRKGLQTRMKDTTEKCFICGIEKNTFNRTLDREAFRLHTKKDQNLWNYIFFIIFIWENDKDDDDGLETYVRKCVANSDLSWFPMNRAIRLAEHQLKGDVNSLRYKFRKDLADTENGIAQRMFNFKDQISRSIARIENTIELDNEIKTVGRGGGSTRAGRKSSMSEILSEKSGSRQGNSNNDKGGQSNGLTFRIMSITGTNISKNLLRCITVNTVTLKDVYVAHPDIVENDESFVSRSPFSSKSNVDSTLMSFNSSLNGSITAITTEKLTNQTLNGHVNVQLLYGSDNIKKYIGGAKVSVSDLLSASESDDCLEVEFEQKEFELWEQDYSTMTIVDINEEGKSFIPESSFCTLSLSCSASEDIIEKWKKLESGKEDKEEDDDDDEVEEGDEDEEN